MLPRIADTTAENVAIHDFLVQSTLPLLAKIKGQIAIIGTGTLFKIGGRRFIVTTAHTMDEYAPQRWLFSTSPLQGDIYTFGKAECHRFTDGSLDTCVVELQSERAIERLEDGWRFLKFEDIWLPDYSADAIIVAGYPSVRASWDGKDIRGRMFLLRSSLFESIPSEAASSDDPVDTNIDFFVRYKNAVNELTGESISEVGLQGMSGCSIWGYRKRGWSKRGLWSPTFVLRIIGIQSACLRNNYVRGKNWGAILRAIGYIDADLRREVHETAEVIAKRLGLKIDTVAEISPTGPAP